MSLLPCFDGWGDGWKHCRGGQRRATAGRRLIIVDGAGVLSFSGWGRWRHLKQEVTSDACLTVLRCLSGTHYLWSGDVVDRRGTCRLDVGRYYSWCCLHYNKTNCKNERAWEGREKVSSYIWSLFRIWRAKINVHMNLIKQDIGMNDECFLYVMTKFCTHWH